MLPFTNDRKTRQFHSDIIIPESTNFNHPNSSTVSFIIPNNADSSDFSMIQHDDNYNSDVKMNAIIGTPTVPRNTLYLASRDDGKSDDITDEPDCIRLRSGDLVIEATRTFNIGYGTVSGEQRFYRARGTRDAPSNLTGGDNLLFLRCYGFVVGAWYSHAEIKILQNGTITISSLVDTIGNVQVLNITNGIHSFPQTSAISVYKSTYQDVGYIAASVNTAITFDSETYDKRSEFALSAFTPTVGGIYIISMLFGVTDLTGFLTAAAVHVKVNGLSKNFALLSGGISANEYQCIYTTQIQLIAGEIVTFIINHTGSAAGTLRIAGGNTASMLTITKIQ